MYRAPGGQLSRLLVLGTWVDAASSWKFGGSTSCEGETADEGQLGESSESGERRGPGSIGQDIYVGNEPARPGGAGRGRQAGEGGEWFDRVGEELQEAPQRRTDRCIYGFRDGGSSTTVQVMVVPAIEVRRRRGEGGGGNALRPLCSRTAARASAMYSVHGGPGRSVHPSRNSDVASERAPRIDEHQHVAGMDNPLRRVARLPPPRHTRTLSLSSPGTTPSRAPRPTPSRVQEKDGSNASTGSTRGNLPAASRTDI